MPVFINLGFGQIYVALLTPLCAAAARTNGGHVRQGWVLGHGSRGGRVSKLTIQHGGAAVA